MKRIFRVQWILVCLCVGMAVVTGCSSIAPAPSGRRGLFDDLANGGHPRTVDEASRTGPSVAAAPKVSHPSSYRALEFRHSHLTRKVALKVAMRIRKLHFIWPLRHVTVTSPFGRRGREFHEGIDLRAPIGTPVHAVLAGKVIYAGWRIRGYGKMIVLKHRDGLATVYAHNSRLLVRVGQLVRQGQRIAISGKTGYATGPHLHFEIREGIAAIDPLIVLPSRSRARRFRVIHARYRHRVRAKLVRPAASEAAVSYEDIKPRS